jgi:hypothetical protein
MAWNRSRDGRRRNVESMQRRDAVQGRAAIDAAGVRAMRPRPRARTPASRRSIALVAGVARSVVIVAALVILLFSRNAQVLLGGLVAESHR